MACASPQEQADINKSPYHAAEPNALKAPIRVDQNEVLSIKLEGFSKPHMLSLNINDKTYAIKNGITDILDDQEHYNKKSISFANLPGGYSCEIKDQDSTYLSIVCNCEPTQNFQGDGTIDNPIEIWSAQQLNTIATNIRTSLDGTKHYKQMCPLDYTDIAPVPIEPFAGSYDGQGFEIKNYTSGEGTPSKNRKKGLFGYTYKAKIKNISLQNFFIQPSQTSSDEYIGALVGFANHSQIENITAKNITILSNHVKSTPTAIGGIVGRLMGLREKDDVFKATLKNISIKDSAIQSDTSLAVGGVIGSGSNNHGMYENIRAEAVHIKCTKYCGTFAGQFFAFKRPDQGVRYLEVVDSHIETQPGNNSTGGLFGVFKGQLHNSLFQGSISINSTSEKPVDKNKLGGVIGWLKTNSTIDNSIAIADILVNSETTIHQTIAPFFGYADVNDVIMNHVSYVSSQTCNTCRDTHLVHPIFLLDEHVQGVASVNSFIDGTSLSISQGQYPWDFHHVWCKQASALPTLRSLYSLPNSCRI